ncbi:hypothetical protein [Mesorhizobium neociceri]|uniref:Uncharacterized protein n=1 Tax=Mesorhizobium neociceri TaxID=1307853 RepID=A0A838B3S8_9HYPH|nr:hypothetical protein [Mesorhizobium neociceri]MBA1140671.1 hypothetical protein [Mesorhizobium neociceri]
MAASMQNIGNLPPASRHSRRLEELRESAAEIRKRHVDGKISALEAAKELDSLTKKYSNFLERLLDI